MQRFAAWIACFAILLAAFAPSISHAVTSAKGTNASWVEICSAIGSKFVKVADSANPVKSSDSAPGMDHLKHCPFCATHAGSFGLPPTAVVVLPVPRIAEVFPPLFYQAPKRLFVWATAQSRAPPVAS